MDTQECGKVDNAIRAQLYQELYEALADSRGTTELAKALALVRIADALESIDSRLDSVIHESTDDHIPFVMTSVL